MTNNLIKKIIFTIFIFIAFYFFPSENIKTILPDGFYKVVRVIDGDTILVYINGKNQSVRLIGINAPETNDPRKKVECFGKEAKEKAIELLTDKNVRLIKDPTQGDKDKYQRLLRYVFLEDGTNFNKLMIEEGYAFEYTYNIPYQYQKEFKLAQKEAEKNKKGLWADNVCDNFIPYNSQLLFGQVDRVFRKYLPNL